MTTQPPIRIARIVLRTAALALLLLAPMIAAHPSLAAPSPQSSAGAAMTNDDVVKLVRLDLGDALVIESVRRAARVDFRLDVEGLTRLREAGVSREVIKAMFDRVPAPAAAASAAPPAAAPAPPPAAPAAVAAAAPAAAPAASPAPPTSPSEVRQGSSASFRAPAQTEAPAAVAANFEACLAAVRESGSFIKGRQFAAIAEYPALAREKVFETIAANLKSQKYRIADSDRKRWTLTVRDQPPGSPDFDMPATELQFVLRLRDGGGTIAEGVFKTDTATFTHYDPKRNLCRILTDGL